MDWCSEMSDTTVELTQREWRDVLSVMDLGIEAASDRGLTKVASARESLYGKICQQVREQYDGDGAKLGDIVARLEEDLEIERSLHVEETARTMAGLRD